MCMIYLQDLHNLSLTGNMIQIFRVSLEKTSSE